ncbi:FAD-dependent oxidoreductase [Merismopedia glauca]|uniref:FAD-dependent oxidoreductase n=1 Tax=Merismopedia glauca CCAP 1448/3 TaxID=1296344 RepID=A0A2T1C1R3_9CYAN|nr:FAD-dependent oxidoreductase [Merismopedia glauca]PSB02201.1 FAD-dependent oxidoreductase [Merismopedia glauca CCAP 1448/3]
MHDSLSTQILSQIPGNSLQSLRQADNLWLAMRQGNIPIPTVISESSQTLENVEWDVTICGGTLGILLAAALQMRGVKVALLERGILQGREQEWNISRQELGSFLRLGLLTAAELEEAIATEYNPARVSFANSPDIWVQNVLNIGIDPVYLLETLKSKFIGAGGELFEQTPFQTATIHPNGVQIQAGGKVLNTRLLIDAMGHFSPIVRQLRQGKKPEGVCLVVGTCAQGYQKNETGDIFASFTAIQHQCQYFWEAFPARDGRTTYLFTYMDADPERFSLEFLFDEYFRLLPEYQEVELSELKFIRALFGFFPFYRQSPLKPKCDRLLLVGDSSGSQSPVSFGGFGAIVRHLERLTTGITEALALDVLNQQNLAQIQPYQPNIAVTWMFQRAMSVGMNQKLPPDRINQLLSTMFQAMNGLGDEVLRPFLQDVVGFSGLSQTLLRVSLTNPQIVIPIVPQVGIATLLDWLIHYLNLGRYSALYPIGKLLQPLIEQLPPQQRYNYRRSLEAWEYGSGSDSHSD